ncbi:MAG: hypothetical protein QM237_10955 [Bacteroidota bacterium]|jgi:hypothetical protein|nr:hypothetical protein [Bacteroidota bacterium]HHU96823.1 hypothetical protein [Petrimonas sp.]
MKRILFLLMTIALAFVGCEKSDGKLDPNATLSIRPAAGVKLRSTNPEHLTALEIVQQTTTMVFIPPTTNQPAYRGFSEAQRDLNPDDPRLKMWGGDIITAEGMLVEDFIRAKNVVLTIDYRIIDGSDRIDTIAYIPNKTLQDAYVIIKPAFDSGDYEAVYQVFDNAYRFIPITGTEYAELQKQGKN